MIVATAGHVDHGKTSLIRQLTGVDTDRLEEEKRRGLSINLGYAYLPTEGGIPIGFIDVPGHQRFINTMISGISGIDLGMLVIAADDGVMPQTQEHLDVLSVLGVKRLVVVISKIDRVEPERVEDVTAVAANLVQAHHFETLGVFPLDNISGEGIAPLRQFLCSSAQENVAKAPTGCFRLSVDRAFTIKGSGLVVTGTTSTGAVSEGDTLTHFPTGNEVRVRSLRVHDAQAAAAAPGQRCAINLTGDIALSDVERGDWLLGHGCGQATAVIDAEATLLSDAPFSLKHLSPVKIHIGAQRVAGRIALPFSGDEKRMQPGKTRLVQLRLEEPIPTYTGQRFVLRDHAENVTLGGGVIIDPEANHRRKADDATLQRIKALRHVDTLAGLQQLAEHAGWAGLTAFCRARNMSAAECEDVKHQLQASETLEVFEYEALLFVATKKRMAEISDQLHQQLKQLHQDKPRERGLKASVLTRNWQPAAELPLLTTVLKQELQQSALTLSDGFISRAGFKVAKASEQQKAWAAYRKFLTTRGTQIPLLSETTEHTKIALPKLRTAGISAAREGEAFQISERRFALPEHLLLLSEGVLKLAEAGEEISVIALKQQWGLGRNLVVEIVEFFDSVRFTARRDNARIILDAALPQKLFGGKKE